MSVNHVVVFLLMNIKKKSKIDCKNCKVDFCRIFYLKNWNYTMLKEDFLSNNILNILRKKHNHYLSAGEFGAVLSRAGVGKTALLVQIAINEMLLQKKVLHISLNNSVEKVKLWYSEVFKNLENKDYDLRQVNLLWEDIIRRRFIMTFKPGEFSLAKLSKRLSDLSEQDIFTPDVLIIDDYPFDKADKKMLVDLKEFMGGRSYSLWFSVRKHREEDSENYNNIADILNIFNLIIEFEPSSEKISLNIIKSGSKEILETDLYLDPHTMLLNKQ